jgi:hypothetical protein
MIAAKKLSSIVEIRLRNYAGASELLFEEILKGLARIVVARGSRRTIAGSLLGVGGRSGVLLNSGAKFVEGAGVLGILGEDALGDRLGALELGAGVEEATLLAAMELELALGAFAVGIEAGGEDRAAVGTACAGYGADHARGARAELIGARSTLRGLPVMRPVFLFVFFGIAVPAMAIFSIHKCLRPSVLPDCNKKSSHCALTGCGKTPNKPSSGAKAGCCKA